MNKNLLYIPVRNSQKIIYELLVKIPEEIVNNFENILVVDDCSTDFSVREIKKFISIKSELKIELIENKMNLGYGGNQKIAYKYAIAKGYDNIVMLHGDDQYPSHSINELIKLLKMENTALAFGSRITGSPIKGGMPYYRYWLNKLLTSIENLNLKLNLSEYHSGFRAYNCALLKKIPFENFSNDFIFDQQIIFSIVQKKYKILEIPIPTHYGPNSNSIGLFRGVKYSTEIFIELFKFHLTNMKIIKHGIYYQE